MTITLNCVLPILLTVFLILLLYYVPWSSVPNIENFTAPGLTLINPPNWFPENSAAPYRKKEWETKMYLQKYPIRRRNGSYMTPKESDKIASVYRFWRL